jgi:hypothetical protein
VEQTSYRLLIPRRSVRIDFRGRYPDSRIILLANAFPANSRHWLILLAFIPDHSGASVRELHPLPLCPTSIAIPD